MYCIMHSITFIIDGNNVVYNNSKHPRLQHLIILIKDLKAQGTVIPIVSHELQFRIDDSKGLHSLIHKRLILQTPKNTDNDVFLLETCKQTQGFIISNDSFKQYKASFSNEIHRRLPFMIIRSSKGGYLPILPWLHQFSTVGDLPCE